MASENETVAEVVKKVRSGDYGCAKCGDLCDCPNAEKIIISIIDRIEAAHRREVDAILKDRDEMYKSEQETIAKTNAWFEEYQTLKREVAELRECLKEAIVKYCNFEDGECCFLGSNGECRNMGSQCECVKWRKVLEGANYERK